MDAAVATGAPVVAESGSFSAMSSRSSAARQKRRWWLRNNHRESTAINYQRFRSFDEIDQPLDAPHSHQAVDVALLGVAIVWGSSYLAAKEIVATDGVFAFLVIRFGIAATGLAIVVAPKLRHISRAELALGALFGTILAVIFTLETFGVTMTSASNAGLIISLTVVMTPLLDQWIRRTHLPPMFYGAAVIAVAGVGLLSQNSGFAAPSLGDLLILLAAAARAVHVTTIARLSEERTLDSARVTLVQLWTGLLVFAVLSQITGRGVGEVAAHMSPQSWLLTIYLALVCTVFAFFTQIWAVRRTSPARVSLLLGTEPLWAAGFGVLLAHDPVTAIGITGAILILLGTSRGRIIDTRRCDQRIAIANPEPSDEKHVA